MTESTEVVIVGGGLAGAAFAAGMAGAGFNVVVLERQKSLRDRAMGDNLAPWGVVEARALGVYESLLSAPGHHACRWGAFGTYISPQKAEEDALNLENVLPGIPGPLNFSNPAGAESILALAQARGAKVIRGARVQTLETTRKFVSVTYSTKQSQSTVNARLVVGADGKSSLVRRKARIPIFRTDPLHLISGLRVESEWPSDLNLVGTEGKVTALVFPLGSRVQRLYLAHSLHPPQRFVGPAGVNQFLGSFRLRSMPKSSVIETARAAGPCLTYVGNDTWTDPPFRDRVALIGDCAGHNNPIIGQGLSITLRDARILSECLIENRRWDARTFRAYSEERLERMKRLRFVSSIMARLRSDFSSQGDLRRELIFERMISNSELGMFRRAIFLGPHRLPSWAFDDAIRQELFREIYPERLMPESVRQS